MADIALTAAQIGRVDPKEAEVYDFEWLTTAPTVGQAVYVDPTTGKVGVADANDSGKEQFAGIVLSVQGRGVSVLKRGRVYGFTLTGMNYWAIAYLSNTAGALADANGTMTVRVGKVVPITEAGQRIKVLYIDADWRSAWS
jgi:hypothetical protein